MTELGTITMLEPREQWEDEARDFTPWVASPDGLKLIGNTLNIELEEQSSASEVPIGSFRADVVCVDTSNQSTVLIENQLAPTNHEHVGQVLTYAAGLEAVTIIWVATDFREQHRATLEWLNEITKDEYRFFGLKIELLKIGDSLAAPRFNIVVKPNDWTSDVRRRTEERRSASPTGQQHLRYWEAFNLFVSEHETAVRTRRPGTEHYMDFSIGKTGTNISAVRLQRERIVKVHLYLSGGTHRGYFNALHNEKDFIEQEIGIDLEWESRPRASTIALVSHRDPSDEDDWDGQIEWMVDNIEAFDAAFRKRVRLIEPSDWVNEPQSDNPVVDDLPTDD